MWKQLNTMEGSSSCQFFQKLSMRGAFGTGGNSEHVYMLKEASNKDIPPTPVSTVSLFSQICL